MKKGGPLLASLFWLAVHAGPGAAQTVSDAAPSQADRIMDGLRIAADHCGISRRVLIQLEPEDLTASQAPALRCLIDTYRLLNPTAGEPRLPNSRELHQGVILLAPPDPTQREGRAEHRPAAGFGPRKTSTGKQAIASGPARGAAPDSQVAFFAAADRCGFPRAALERGTQAHPYRLTARDESAFLCLMQAVRQQAGDGPLRIGRVSTPPTEPETVLVRTEQRAPMDVELVLRAVGTPPPAPAFEATRETIVRRLAARGFAGATVVRRGADRLVVRGEGILDPGGFVQLASQPGRVEFRLSTQSLDAEDVDRPIPTGSEALPALGVAGDAHLLIVRRDVLLDGTLIAGARQGFEQGDSRAVVIVTFTDEGRRRFAAISEANVGKQIAIVIDGMVVSAPTILEPIAGGAVELSNNDTIDDAADLAALISSGTLPVRVEVMEEHILPDR